LEFVSLEAAGSRGLGGKEASELAECGCARSISRSASILLRLVCDTAALRV